MERENLQKTIEFAGPRQAGFQLSGGEIHFLWWFIQGSIMVPFTRQRLRKAWGLCERHAWGFILVEAAFRHGYMHGPAILYEDLLEPAILALGQRGLLKQWLLWLHLREKGPCLMCEMNLGPETKGAATPDRIVRGRDTTELRRFAQRTHKYWEIALCGRCLGNGAVQRCRRHLMEDASRGGALSLSAHFLFLKDIFEHLVLYSRSFRWEYQGTETEEDEAALISAVGWCSGRQPLLSILGMNK